MVGGKLVAMRGGDAVDELLEFWLVERDEFATAHTDEVMMMRLKRVGEFVALFSFDVEHFNDVVLHEQTEGAVDAGTFRDETLFDNLVDRQGLGVGIENLKDFAPRFGEADISTAQVVFELFHVLQV